MSDRFDYATYWDLLQRLMETHRITRFCDFLDTEVEEPFVILRHDVDYSPAAALALAEQEAARSVRATYFLLAGSPYYNLVDPHHAGFARSLVELGHEVGLHYDPNSFLPFPREEWPGLLRGQARLLEDLGGCRVVSIAMHQPGLNGADPFGNQNLGFLNAFDARFTRDMRYVSDSCRAWREEGWALFGNDPPPRRLHLALHPINWGATDRDRMEIFARVHDDAIRAMQELKDELLDRIRKHSGVIEHEARFERMTDDRS